MWNDLRLWEIQVEALAECSDSPGPCLEAGAAAVLHHLHQQDDPVCMLAAGQEPLDAQHLRHSQPPESAVKKVQSQAFGALTQCWHVLQGMTPIVIKSGTYC